MVVDVKQFEKFLVRVADLRIFHIYYEYSLRNVVQSALEYFMDLYLIEIEHSYHFLLVLVDILDSV